MGKWDCSQQVLFRYGTGKKTPGEPGHTQDIHGAHGRTHGHTDHTEHDQPHRSTIQNNPPKIQPARQRDNSATIETAAVD
jgi:hypothetical protein